MLTKSQGGGLQGGLDLALLLGLATILAWKPPSESLLLPIFWPQIPTH